ncbi:MAG: EamA family transporter RarD [Proteobacteria bacterium]|nr:EamA family transporter RarD [Pseudomonadota bacterium]
MKKYAGVLAAAGAYILWGVLPAYWKLLREVPAYEILSHRIVWSLLLTLGFIVLLGRKDTFLRAARERKNRITFSTTALLLAINWLLYIWAVNAGFIVEASLGYFINPLINVLFGMVFFRERLRAMQWAAIFFAFLGVLYLTFYYGQFPWIAMVLAVTFAIYGLLHKKNPLGPLDGLCLETGVFFIPCVVFLVGLEYTQGGSFGHIGLHGSLLLAGAGIITTVPLLLFGYAAHKIPLSTLGLLQYLAPSINLLLGVYVYGEDFSRERMVGFLFIWIGIALYVAENMLCRLRAKRSALADRN